MEKQMDNKTNLGKFVINKKDVRDFFDGLAPHWDDGLDVDNRKINCILDAAGVQAGVRVLDVACGTGVLFPFYTQRHTSWVTAVDISPKMAEIASSKAGNKIQVICNDIEAMEGTGKYDCCVIYNAFPHFPDPAGLIAHLAAWLRPGGRLTVAHGMSMEQLNRHHADTAAAVSRGMIPPSEMRTLFSRWFHVDTAVADDEKYIVSGTLLEKNTGKAAEDAYQSQE